MTQSVPEKVKDLVTGSIALRRFGEPVEIADAVAFLGELKCIEVCKFDLINFSLSTQHLTRAHT